MPPLQAATVFMEDFSITTTLPGGQGYLGFFNTNVEPDGVVVATGSSIINEALVVAPDANFRGVGIALDSATLSSAGAYRLQLDILSFDPGMNGTTIGTGFAQVAIYSGDGYQADNDNNALELSADTGVLTSQGNASASLLTTQQFTSAEDNISIDFNYDGSGAIVIFLGGSTGPFPFPTIIYDNISVASIPEPSTMLLVMLSPIVLLNRKRLRK